MTNSTKTDVPLVEAVAQAICEGRHGQAFWELLTPDGKEMHRSMARAALAVVAEHLTSDEAVRAAWPGFFDAANEAVLVNHAIGGLATTDDVWLAVERALAAVAAAITNEETNDAR